MKPRHHDHQLAKQIRRSLRRESRPYIYRHHFPYNALVTAAPKVWYVKPCDDLDVCMVFASKAQAEKYLSGKYPSSQPQYEIIHCTLQEARRQAVHNSVSYLRRNTTYSNESFNSYGDLADAYCELPF